MAGVKIRLTGEDWDCLYGATRETGQLENPEADLLHSRKQTQSCQWQQTGQECFSTQFGFCTSPVLFPLVYVEQRCEPEVYHASHFSHRKGICVQVKLQAIGVYIHLHESDTHAGSEFSNLPHGHS